MKKIAIPAGAPIGELVRTEGVGTGKTKSFAGGSVLHIWGKDPYRAIRISDRENTHLHEQLEMLPDADAISATLSRVEDLDHLREFAIAITAVAVEGARGECLSVESLDLLNGWFATMEEIVADGDDMEEILARRIESWNSTE